MIVYPTGFLTRVSDLPGQPLWLPRAIVNHAPKGFDEYANNALRASPSEPSQALFFVYPQRHHQPLGRDAR